MEESRLLVVIAIVGINILAFGISHAISGKDVQIGYFILEILLKLLMTALYIIPFSLVVAFIYGASQGLGYGTALLHSYGFLLSIPLGIVAYVIIAYSLGRYPLEKILNVIRATNVRSKNV